MLRDCVWSRSGQLSTFQKDLSPAAGKKRSDGQDPVFVERTGTTHLLLFLSLFKKTTYEE